MEVNKLISKSDSLKFKMLGLLTIILCPVILNAQGPADFSGTWIQDNAKSDDFYKEFGITNVITQTPEKITFKETFSDKSGNEIITRESFFNLDGKEVSKEEQGGINKEQATWSTDKKSLTIKVTRTVGNDVYGSTTTYSFSEDGQILNVKISDINPMGPTVNQVFTRKK
jgi:hypothetical protein